VRGAGTDQATVEPVDFGEIACHVITTVAANLGGVEALLAGRHGSWEAGYVCQIVQKVGARYGAGGPIPDKKKVGNPPIVGQ